MSEHTDDFADVRERVEAATPGPWAVDGPAHPGPDDWLTVYPEGVGGSIAYVQPLWDDAEFISAAREDIPRLLEALDEARETNRRLNRRVTQAEAQVMTTVEDCRRQGMSLGRGLANAACARLEEERDAARAKVARVREVLTGWDAHEAEFPTTDETDRELRECVAEFRAAIDGGEKP